MVDWYLSLGIKKYKKNPPKPPKQTNKQTRDNGRKQQQNILLTSRVEFNFRLIKLKVINFAHSYISYV